jgi:hypothetical protein
MVKDLQKNGTCVNRILFVDWETMIAILRNLGALLYLVLYKFYSHSSVAPNFTL